MAFEWKERYSLGMTEIDKQHRKLFEIGARVYDLAMLNDSYDRYDEIMDLLDELFDYTKYHFKYEEGLMKIYNYDNFDQQKQEHDFYIEKIQTIATKDIDKDQRQTTMEIVDFLSEWISSHIMFSDRNYATYFKEKGVC